MKIHFVFLILIWSLLPLNTFAQIPNGGLENWTGGNPDNWTTNNIPGFFDLVTQSNDSYSGNYSARMEMMYTMGSLLQPVLNAGLPGSGIPVSQRHSTTNFYYKYYPITASVALVISVGMYKNSQFIGVGVGSRKAAASSYTKMTVTIDYFNQEIPDAATIYVTLIDSLFNPSSVGTYALVDDFYFDQLINVKDEEADRYIYSLGQNFPNPFNPLTVINYELAEDNFVTLKVYNSIGKEITTLLNEYKLAGAYEIQFAAKDLPGGVYFYKIQAGRFSLVKKMILLK